MLFNSLHFALFFPIVTCAFFLVPGRARWLLLVGASAYFYMALVPAYILILLFLIAIDYVAGIVIGRAEGRARKAWLIVSLLANAGVLGFFKYLAFALDQLAAVLHLAGNSWTPPGIEIALPVGLSFHTFQSVSYTIEVYRGRQKPERNLVVYALYVLFYPQLVAGPIERPQNLLPRLHDLPGVSFDAERVSSGLRLMLWGLLKKVVVADRLAAIVDRTYSSAGQSDSVALCVAAYAFSIQIYCDFSGYTDIARGAARVMGVDLMQNFARPYEATSFVDFWRRWHISLSSWFRDYVYIPLGGNRQGAFKAAAAAFLVFLVSGLWHGANWTFVVWGAIHGLLVVGENVVRRFAGAAVPRAGIWAATKWLFVFNAVTLAWVFFRAPTLDAAWEYLTRLFSGEGFGSLRGHNLGEPVDLAIAFLAAIGVLALESAEARLGLMTKLLRAPRPLRWAAYYAGILLFIFCGSYAPQQFIYFQF